MTGWQHAVVNFAVCFFPDMQVDLKVSSSTKLDKYIYFKIIWCVTHVLLWVLHMNSNYISFKIIWCVAHLLLWVLHMNSNGTGVSKLGARFGSVCRNPILTLFMYFDNACTVLNVLLSVTMYLTNRETSGAATYIWDLRGTKHSCCWN